MAHVYWRVYVTRATNATSIAEWKFFDSSGTQIPTTGGSASASSTVAGFVPANAFDGNINTFWAGLAATGGPAQWLQYQFPSAADPASFSLTPRNDGSWGQIPVDFTIQYSDDGTNWTMLWQYYGVPWDGAAIAGTFTAANASPALGVAYRLYITTNDGFADGTVSFARWTLYDTGGNLLPTSRYAAPVSSQFADTTHTGMRVFDGGQGSGALYWASNPGLPEWIAYIFADPNTQIGRFCISQRVNNGGQTPTAVELQRSFDLVTWETIGSFDFTWPLGSTGSLCKSPLPRMLFFVIT